MDSSFIIGLSKSLLYWTNYLVQVSRERIINEGSIKYGISEFLEVNKQQKTSKRGIIIPDYIINYNFEESHPHFKSRRIDLYVEGNVCHKYLEFKYVRSETLDTEEENRYVYDIFRLHSLVNHVEPNNKIKAYFMILGKKEFVKSALMLPETANHRDETLPHNPLKKEKFIAECINKMLSFETVTPEKTFRIGDLRCHNSVTSQSENFNKEYKPRKKKYKINDEQEITTKLVFSSISNESSSFNCDMSVFVWEIIAKKS